MPSKKAARFERKPGRFKKTAFFSVIILLAALLTEALLRVFVTVIHRPDYSITGLRDTLVSASKPGQTDVLGATTTIETSRHILNPYVGFVADPEQNPLVNKRGWFGPDPVGKRSPGAVRIIIFGGSVAQIFYESARTALINDLKSNPGFNGKKIEVYDTALSGYKQPQQLEALTYLLSTGSEYDIAINIDGFNEIALPYAENWRRQVAVDFPRGWNYYSKKTISNNALDAMIKLDETRSERQQLATIFNRPVLKDTMITLALWKVLDTPGRRSEHAETGALNEALSADTYSFETHGPASSITDEHAILQEFADTWYNSSLQMSRLLKANNTAYFHFLQPNQYVPGSKIFSAQEKSHALPGLNIRPVSVDDYNAVYFKDAVVNGYPILQSRGKQLQQQGIIFRDLTGIFTGTRDTLYIDGCCHFNEEGNTIMAAEIARTILESYPPR